VMDRCVKIEYARLFADWTDGFGCIKKRFTTENTEVTEKNHFILTVLRSMCSVPSVVVFYRLPG
jgi:hypothetical protein